MRFIVDGELIEIFEIDPTLTVLQYLREQRLRVGSKEGCAEGDCGACTVVLAELVQGQLQYRAVNACIQFMPTLDGKALFTVESLRPGDGELHPVQQAMVDLHGSQCGFCTPGFIMSMFALYHNNPSPDRAEIDDALSGNLCRCTGYRPIIDACMKMYEYPPVALDERKLIEQLEDLQHQQTLSIELPDACYHAPAKLEQLAALYQQQPEARILAGGTDVGLWVTKQLRELPEIIYIGNVEELKQLRHEAGKISIGAAVSLTDSFAVIGLEYPELGEMFRRFASVPVRNAGTLVGNIANGSPIGDSMPALMVIGTQVLLRQGDNQRRMPLQDLYLDYMQNAMQVGEFIEAIKIPSRSPDLQLRCYKISKRFDQDISAVCAAFAIRLDADKIVDVAIALGGMAAIPKRATETEQLLINQRWNETTLKQAQLQLQQEFTPMSDMRASADYRQRVCANLLHRFYLETRIDDALSTESVNVFAVTG